MSEKPEQGSDVVAESDLDPKLKALYLRGVSAMELRNWGYVISLFQAVLKQEPRFLDCRRQLRMAAVKQQAGKKSFGTESMKAMGLQREVKKNPAEAMVSVEKDVLATDPFNAQGNQILFDAAMAVGMPRTAGFALETLTDGHPENTKYWHQLGEFYYEANEFERAAEVYDKILKKDPSDLVANQRGKDATARQSMSSQKWDGGSFQDLLANKEEANQLEQSNRAGMTRDLLEERRDQLLAEYGADQNNINVVKQLADCFEQLEDFNSALTYYEWAYSLSSKDPSLEKKAADLREVVQEKYLTDLQEWIAANPDHPEIEEQKAKLAEMTKEMSSGLIEEARKRVERNPTDMSLRFDLGQRLFAIDEYREAIQHLQQAKRSPNLRIKVMNMLGQCYAKLNMRDLAAQQFEEAILEIPAMDATKKELLYNVGLLYLDMGDKAKSLEFLKQIYAADYGYRDVAERVESSYQDS
ncbi:MAG: tetratricopeptide repeat protein [Verrucomicrobiae bacterium]|nr:tetratricopeptide repeat protein [Verrucomicrobiae bacterium]